MELRNLIFILVLLFGIIEATGQVTVGSDKEAANGALLDLKMEGATTKGLGLPRVKLSTVAPKLGKLAESIGSTSGAEPWNEAQHVGLLIYNTEQTEGCLSNVYYDPPMPGSYVWNGEVWEPLFEKEKVVDVRTITYNGERINTDGQAVGSFTMSYTDESNNSESRTYYYASFGVAGTWMTQNLDTKYASDGTALKNSAANADIGRDKYNYAYPSTTTPRDPATYNACNDANIRVGLLYDWWTATNSRNCNKGDQGQVRYLSDSEAQLGSNEIENIEEKKYIQGICPQGWHLPSDRECNELEKELTQYADKYANGTYTAAEKNWEDSWEQTPRTNFSRGPIIGKVMKSTTKVTNASNALSNADSKPAEDGGFNLYMVGYANSNNAGTTEYSSSYSVFSDFWSSSSAIIPYSGNEAWVRALKSESGESMRLVMTMRSMIPIRCKKMYCYLISLHQSR